MHKVKRSLSMFLSVLFLMLTIIPISSAIHYPTGITPDKSSLAIERADKTISAFLKSSENKTLKDIVLPEIYSDKTLSALTIKFYSTIEENVGEISNIGIKASPKDVASCLHNYPSVANKLSAYTEWKNVNLDNVTWNAKNKEDFSSAISSVFFPFNSLLYTLLCGGSYSITPIIGIKGDKGYENSIVPMLKALGCKTITEKDTFYKDAYQDKTSMIKHAAIDVLTLIESALDNPCNELSNSIPSIAYFFENKGFDDAVSKLVKPLRLQVFNISTFIKVEYILKFIQNSESYTANTTININSMLQDSEFNAAPINFKELASCGTASDDNFVSDKPAAFIVLLKWLVDTLKLNKDSIAETIKEKEILTIINKAIETPTDSIVSLLIKYLSEDSGEVNNYQWQFKEYVPVTTAYTPNLGPEKYQRVVDGIDPLINEIVKETGAGETVRDAFQNKIYSNETVTKLACSLYGSFDDENVKQVINMLGVNVSPSDVANALKTPRFSTAKHTLSRSSSWSRVNSKSLKWGFKDGDEDGFAEAVSAVLNPLEPILKMLLAEDSINVLGSLPIYGSNGYNTAVIPLLEALNCPDILTYEEFKAEATNGNTIKAIITPVVSLIDKFLDKPGYTIIDILPNFVYFIDSGSLETCLNNLFYPFDDIISAIDIDLDLPELNIKDLVSDLLKDSKIILPEFNPAQLAGLGQVTTITSKRTIDGQLATISYIQADKPAVVVTVLRYLARTIKTPGNENLLSEFMPESNDTTISSFAGNISGKFKTMNEDETVEWIYNLFFKERVIKEDLPTDNYYPTIIYVKENEKGHYGFVILVLIIALIVVIRKRKHIREKIMYWKNSRKIKEEILNVNP